MGWLWLLTFLVLLGLAVVDYRRSIRSRSDAARSVWRPDDGDEEGGW